MTPPRLTYRFGPLERRGLFGAVRAGQVAIVGAGVIAAMIALDGTSSPAGALFGTCLVGLACAAAWLPLGRRGLDEWLPLLASFVWRGLRARRSFRSPSPLPALRPARCASSFVIAPGPGASAR